jgi:tetratricopeptide (TPR) repeat protein
MPFHSLYTSDLPAWRAYPDYSVPVAAALDRAYVILFGPIDSPRRYEAALHAVESVQNLPMCPPQRLRIDFVKSVVYANLSENVPSLEAIDEAIAGAEALQDTASLRDGLHFRGPILRRVSLLEQAAEDYQRALTLQRELGEVIGAFDPVFELDLLSQLVGYTFYSGHYDAAEQTLEEAHTVAARTPRLSTSRKGKLLLARLDLGEAHLLRWRGEAALALEPASRASAVFTELGSPSNAGRVESMLSDCALDVAERVAQGTHRDSLLRLARRHIDLARAFAQEGEDQMSTWMIRLREARYSRLVRANEDRIAAILKIARLAQAVEDEVMLSEAFTFLGDELASQGEIESALNRYREAIAVMEGSEVPAQEKWARRSIHEWREQQRH